MIDLRHLIATAIAIPLLPLFLVQGRHVRRVTPRLPGAAGPTTGRAGSGTRSVRLLVIGESTVAGVGATSHESALTGQLALALSERFDGEVVWYAVGKNGLTAEGVRSELVPTIPVDTVDIVVIVLGVNDVLKLHSPARWQRDLAHLVLSVRQRVGKVPVFLAAMPPMGLFPAFPQPLRAAIGARSAALARATIALARHLEDVTACSGTVEEDPRYFCADRFHPSEAGYRAWGRVMSLEIERRMGDRP